MAAANPEDTVVALDGVYLRTYLKPFLPWLERDDVTEILVNRPGEVWVEVSGEPAMLRLDMPEVDDTLLNRLAAQIARVAHQGINRGKSLACGQPAVRRARATGRPAGGPALGAGHPPPPHGRSQSRGLRSRPDPRGNGGRQEGFETGPAPSRSPS
ncbi:MAG: hypothetical protein WDN06_06930 [Asticcacaulis sp.]